MSPRSRWPRAAGFSRPAGAFRVYANAYDVSTRTVEVNGRWWPAEPDNSNLCANVRQKAYPVVEKSGILFAYMGPGEPPADFRIDGPSNHGVAGIVNLFGIESPGMTAALAIGEEVVAILEGT